MTRANVSRLPYRDGDGYSWGGDVIVTFGERAIHVGTTKDDFEFAMKLADTWNKQEATK